MIMLSSISDHAVLRYIERVYGVDIEAVRREIAEVPGLANAVAMKAKSWSTGGVTFGLSPAGAILTVMPNATPQAARREGNRIKYGRSAKARGAQNSRNHVKTGTARREDRRPMPEPDYDEAY